MLNSLGNILESSTEKMTNEGESTAHTELLELGIFVHNYELYIAKQINDILPTLKSMPSRIRKTGKAFFAA